MFSILGPIRKRKGLDPVKKLTDWLLFENLVSELIFPDSSNEADKATHNFAIFIASVYWISTEKLQF
jgi:hypothetical protein